ncbi:MAG: hypothetical protein HYX72_12940 [Acidobacteria bacterium]|nr:hypothetical protein [Acidobacteriota bacterium]
MRREELEGLTLEELHRLALERCTPQFRKRAAGFMAGHRRFLLALLERSGGPGKNRPYSQNTAGEP